MGIGLVPCTPVTNAIFYVQINCAVTGNRPYRVGNAALRSVTNAQRGEWYKDVALESADHSLPMGISRGICY